MPPALDLGLVSIFWEALEIFDRQLFGGRAVPSEILADEWVIRHGPPSKRGLGGQAINLRAKRARSRLKPGCFRMKSGENPRPKVFGNVWDSSQTRPTVKLIWSHSTPAKFS